MANATRPFGPVRFSAIVAVLGATVSAHAEDLSAGLKKGDALVQKLPEIDPAFSIDAYFEAFQGDKTIGHGELLVRAQKLEGQLGYEYRHSAFMRLSNGVSFAGEMNAVLDRRCSPARISAVRRVRQPGGPEQVTSETAIIGADKITMTRSAGEKEATQEQPRPEGSLVFGIDFLLQRLDLTESLSFVLRELDFQEGTAVHQRVIVTARPDGGFEAEVVMEGNELLRQSFVLDSRKELVSFTEAPIPVVCKRVPKERFEELKASFSPGP